MKVAGMFKNDVVRKALFIGLAGAVVGCSSAEAPEGASQSLSAERQAPLEFVNAKGQVFIRKGKLQTAKPNVDSNGAMIPVADTSRAVDLNSLSDVELAKAISPKVAWAGYEYVAESDPIELVRAARANKNAVVGTSGFNPSGDADVAAEALSGKQVIGADGRSLRRDNTSYPWRAMAWLDTGCTGTFIGASTLITAAHCVNDGTSWMLPTAYPGYDSQDADPDPYGSFGCYSITIPGGWDTSHPIAYDYAVLEYSGCGVYPGNTVGWLGVYATNTEANIEGTTINLGGYPGDKANYPQIWYMANSSLNASSPAVYHTIDTYNGQSGSAIYQFRTGSPCDGRCVIGIHKGATGSQNWGRWLDTTVWSFIQTYSAL